MESLLDDLVEWDCGHGGGVQVFPAAHLPVPLCSKVETHVVLAKLHPLLQKQEQTPELAHVVPLTCLLKELCLFRHHGFNEHLAPPSAAHTCSGAALAPGVPASRGDLTQ